MAHRKSTQNVVDGFLQWKRSIVAPSLEVVVVQGETHRATKPIVGYPLGLDRDTFLIVVRYPPISTVHVWHFGFSIENSGSARPSQVGAHLAESNRHWRDGDE